MRCLLALLLAAPLSAQEMPILRAPWRGDRSEPMRLESLRIDVKVAGHVATTTWDLTVRNPQGRVLEGELVFPLGEGQTVSRFAMDVNGRLREGVVVDKAKGRQAFEEIVRRNVDPGLLEKTAGNSFRARVYPIPAHGTKRLLLAYEQELGHGGPEALLYRLPLAFRDRVKDFQLRVEVADPAAPPRLQAAPAEGFAFHSWKRAYIAEMSRTDFLPDRPMTFEVPLAEDHAGIQVERRDGATYFHVAYTPRLPREPKPLPRRLVVAWDASASGRSRKVAEELDLLEAYLRRIGTCEVSLVIFRDAAEAPRPFQVAAGDAGALRKAIQEAPFDGGTNLGALDLAKIPADEILLFSDGLHTFGNREPALPPCPVVAIHSSTSADHAGLRALAERSGGESLNLGELGQSKAMEALRTLAPTFLRATFEPGSVQELYPSGGTALRGAFGLAGLLLKPKARITLHFGVGRAERRRKVIELDGEGLASELPVSRLWAQKKLAELELDRGPNAKAIRDLGETYSIVTEGTSLIVLDDVADYLRYEITPPAELRAEYDRRRGEVKRLAFEKNRTHLEQLVTQFQERVTWWQTEFKPGPVRVDKPTRERGALAEAAVEVVAAAGAPSEMPRPAPAPMPVAMDAAPGQVPTKKARKETGPEPEPAARIELKAWSPDTPYLRELKALPAAARYVRYLALREAWGSTPGFFLDVADLFREQGEEVLALRILSNLAELKLEDPTLLRVLGHRLRQLKRAPLAVACFEEVLRLREEEPQSHRDLALASAEAGRAQRALDLLWHVAKTPWDPRFRDVSLIACGEMNALLAQHSGLSTAAIDPRLLKNLPVDIRVVLNWDTDNSDMDLHVVDPRGEACFYGHARTALGGRISGDVTGGYGPEEFLLRKAIPGTFKVKAKFFGTRQQTAIGATTVVLELYLRYATGRMENKSITLRLDGPGRMVDIGEFQFDGAR